jgi:hypothetical protein
LYLYKIVAEQQFSHKNSVDRPFIWCYNIGVVNETEQKMSIEIQILVHFVVLMIALAVVAVAVSLCDSDDE